MDTITSAIRRPRDWQPSQFIRLSIGLHLVAGGFLALRPEGWPLALETLALDHLILASLGLWPKSRGLGPNWRRLPFDDAFNNRVALTFDDGPDPIVTPKVLDLLDATSSTATFFCIGERVLQHKGLVQDIVARGHTIENHSHYHRLGFACSSVRGFVEEIGRAQEAIAEMTGRAPRFFRAPFGFRSPLLEPALCELGLDLVSWTRRGYDTRERSPQRIQKRLLQGLSDGDILLLHDGHSAKSLTDQPVVLDVLADLLATLREEGLQGVSLDQGIPAFMNDNDAHTTGVSES
ncbi:MAG: polysaccharide deacetylase family protein [Methylococcus sp.]|jgi:peptidoglycan-N-acetylglucosamine deacetylase